MIFNKTGNIKKDSSGIRRILPLPGVTASVRPTGLTSRQPPAIQIKDSFGIVVETNIALSELLGGTIIPLSESVGETIMPLSESLGETIMPLSESWGGNHHGSVGIGGETIMPLSESFGETDMALSESFWGTSIILSELPGEPP